MGFRFLLLPAAMINLSLYLPLLLLCLGVLLSFLKLFYRFLSFFYTIRITLASCPSPFIPARIDYAIILRGTIRKA